MAQSKKGYFLYFPKRDVLLYKIIMRLYSSYEKNRPFPEKITLL